MAQPNAPLSFTENKGQWDPVVRYRAEVSAGAFYLRSTGFTVVQQDLADLVRVQDMLHRREKSDQEFPVRSHAYSADFIGAGKAATFQADKPLPGVSNYFIGNDPAQWGTGCREYQGVTVRDLYPNIDLRYYSENGKLKYDLIVRPGGDPGQIELRYSHTDGLSIKEKGLLQIETSVGAVRELPPYAYQYTDAGRQTVTCNYRLKDSTLRFNVRAYDSRKVLVIDPTIVFASFAGSHANNWGYTATYGPDGSFFGGGIVFGPGFPTYQGSYQQNFGNGSVDIGIIKLSPDGSSREYATYIGGSGDEQPHSLWCDPAGNLIIAGRSNSANFPSLVSKGPNGSFDLVVVKLNATGSALLGSIRMGGSGDDCVNIDPSHSGPPTTLKHNYGDDGRSEVILDDAGNIYVASCSRATGFPVTNGSTLSGEQDAVVVKINPALSDLVWATYLGGTGLDGAYVLSVGPINGNLYVGGGTTSPTLPGASGTMGPANHGDVDGFVTEFTNSGTLLRTAFIGTPAYDQIYGLKMDRTGIPYIMGQTLGSWQNVNAAYHVANARQFIAKLEPDLSGFIYSMAFGTSNASDVNISPTAFLVDRCENVYVSGWGGAASGFTSVGTLGLPVTSDAVVMTPPYNSPAQTDGKDFYFFVLKKNATQQLYGSFFGENSPNAFPDHVDGGTSRFDANGVIYQATCANCTTPHPYWPATPGAWAQQNPANGCNLGMIKIALNLAGLAAGVQSSIDGVVRDTAGCVPLTVQFRDTVANAVTYEWDLNGDGVTDQTTTQPNIQYTYNAVGSYRVRLIAVDPNSCNVRDTSYVNIRVGSLKAKPDFGFRKLNPCDSLKFEFTNLTPPQPSRPFTNNTFVWQFLDENSTETRGPGPFSHSFPRPGSYRVRLTIVDTSFCNAPESKDTVVNVAVLVKARFETPATGCAPYNAVFTNTSEGGQTFTWDFGDGTTSTAPTPPPHFYPNPGTYTIRLTAVDSGTCNIIDSTKFVITLSDKPQAGIGTVSPQPPIPNSALTFENTSSSDAVSFKWLYGDGDTLLTISRLPVRHEYNTADSFEVLLIAINANGCPDTTRRWVTTLVEPAVDVPNAFTPLSGGINSIVYARGFGIADMHFTIWNRWGQKVFETNDRHLGWDGTYKGKLQPMDVYAYTLEVTFVDGKKATKKGDITLIR
ncbi:PKD domain-containing protein [Flaviaesturariibacter aridisoli]|uniref:PKD domain-containing protein n=2 Tax=Flaviaesturariibacter aridisoli TaxID=2545761 RepID=A0A4R4E7Q0_9BACT|nr:PKD domain-containing protein [Flaviaesturariibacter aridisoli]